MVDDDYPRDSTKRHTFRWIERHVVSRCSRAIFTTPGAIRMYAERYPSLPSSRWKMIPNGYDDDNFRSAEEKMPSLRRSNEKITLVHSGLLYRSERDPRHFFAALKQLLNSGKISGENLSIILRASRYEHYYNKLIQEYGIHEIVSLAAAVPYEDALVEILTADGLLIFQASVNNHLVPAKIYEYLRARRPIFALTDRAGDTASLLRHVGIDTIVPLDSTQQIAGGLLDFLARLRAGSAPIASDSEIAKHSRKARTHDLAKVFDTVTIQRV
jgi:glycosyltransferase involved in cell wall biosynthesis